MRMLPASPAEVGCPPGTRVPRWGFAPARFRAIREHERTAPESRGRERDQRADREADRGAAASAAGAPEGTSHGARRRAPADVFLLLPARRSSHPAALPARAGAVRVAACTRPGVNASNAVGCPDGRAAQRNGGWRRGRGDGRLLAEAPAVHSEKARIGERIWSRRSDLNRGPADYESAALPTELRRLTGRDRLDLGPDVASYHVCGRRPRPRSMAPHERRRRVQRLEPSSAEPRRRLDAASSAPHDPAPCERAGRRVSRPQES
jgi:hypothetical protein